MRSLCFRPRLVEVRCIASCLQTLDSIVVVFLSTCSAKLALSENVVITVKNVVKSTKTSLKRRQNPPTRSLPEIPLYDQDKRHPSRCEGWTTHCESLVIDRPRQTVKRSRVQSKRVENRDQVLVLHSLNMAVHGFRAGNPGYGVRWRYE